MDTHISMFMPNLLIWEQNIAVRVLVIGLNYVIAHMCDDSVLIFVFCFYMCEKADNYILFIHNKGIETLVILWPIIISIIFLTLLVLIISVAAQLAGSMDGRNHSVCLSLCFWDSLIHGRSSFSSWCSPVCSMWQAWLETSSLCFLWPSILTFPHVLPTGQSSLSFTDLGACSATSPKMIYDPFRKHKVISFGGCIAQIFFDPCHR